MTSLLDTLRAGRSSGAVLKTRISQVRSKFPELPIFVFEGDEDIGPYEVWVRQMSEVRYCPVPAKGKGQVLNCRDSILADRTSSFSHVYFFVDRDFDGIRGKTPGDDLFVTSTYSIENEMLVEDVISSILLDEFKLFIGDDAIDKILGHARFALNSISASLRAANLRIFVARLSGVPIQIDESVSKYIRVDKDGAQMSHTEKDLEHLVKYERLVTAEECAAAEIEFVALDPIKHYRGKFLLRGFLSWIHVLAELRAAGGNEIFVEPMAIKVGPQQLSLRALASRRAPPSGLVQFIRRIETTASH